ncbi:hypothetical protein BKA62DRAFT_692519 [Auriculariales sp. MPI-PUGE-AT-0066]|nr:hypothetical protein BKA62DRAFT_692519 [Auriculariales sp. MPI-PUGE-AT-0066]
MPQLRRKRVVQSDDSNDEVIETTHHGVPVRRTDYNVRPKKRARVRAAPRDILLETLQTGGKPLFAVVLSYCPPRELLCLSYTCRGLRGFLHTPNAARIWRQSRANVPGPSPPPCPPSLTEWAWTRMLHGIKCEACWRTTTRDIDFSLRVRFCSKCQKKQVRSQDFILNDNRRFEMTSEGKNIFLLVPSSRTAGGSTKKTSYFWVPEVSRVYNKLSALDDEVNEEVTGARRLRTAYVKERLALVKEIRDSVRGCTSWLEQYRLACDAEEKTAQEELRTCVVQKITELGYPQEDVEAILLDEKLDADSLLGSKWTNLLKRTMHTLDTQRSEDRDLLTNQAAALREAYRSFQAQYVPRDWEGLVPFGDITHLPEVKSRLRTLRPRHMDDFAAKIPDFIAIWRKIAESKLLATLPPQHGRHANSSVAAKLRLATSLWLRGDEAEPQTYPRMFLVPHQTVLNHGPLPYALESGPWIVDGLRFDFVGSEIARLLCLLMGINPNEATVGMLDDVGCRVHCKLCAETWPLVLNWRQAIQHVHEQHNGTHLPPNSWRRASVTSERAAVILDKAAKHWVCRACRADGQGNLRAQRALAIHLDEIHKIKTPLKGKDFERSFLMPTSRPLDVFQMHASNDGALWTCRYCVVKGAKTEILKHLHEGHDIELVPLEVHSGTHVQIRRRASSSPGPSNSSSSHLPQGQSDNNAQYEEDIIHIKSPGPPPETLRADGSLHDVAELLSSPYAVGQQLEEQFLADTDMSIQISTSPLTLSSHELLRNRQLSRRSRSVLPDDSEESGDDINLDTLAALSHTKNRTKRVSPIPPTIAQVEEQRRSSWDNKISDPDEMDIDEVDIPFECEPSARTSGNIFPKLLSSPSPAPRLVQLPSLGPHRAQESSNQAEGLPLQRPRGTSDHLPSARPREPINSHGQLVCRMCTRTVDKSRRYTSSAIDIHLRTKHEILAPDFRLHYGNAPVEDEFTVMPWVHGRAYRCLLCPDNTRNIWDFDKLNIHFSAFHKLADPHPCLHFTFANMPENLGQRAVMWPRRKDTATKPKVKISVLVAQQRQALPGLVDGDIPDLTIFRGFICSLCDNGVQYSLPHMMSHSARHHCVAQPTFGQDYTVLRRRLGVVLAKEARADEYRYLCNVCGDWTRLYRLEGVVAHLEDRHQVCGLAAEAHIEDAEQTLGSDDLQTTRLYLLFSAPPQSRF